MFMNNAKGKKSWLQGIKNPNGYVVIFFIIMIVTLLTWIIPSGSYERLLDEVSNKTVVVPNSFKYIEDKSVGLFAMLQAIPKGITQSSGIIAFIFVISGAIQIIRGTGALDAGIFSLMEKLKGKDKPLLVVVILIFSLLGASFGFAEETIPFIPLGASLAVALGYDRVVGFHIVRTSAWIGFAGAFLNPFTIGVAQSIAELPLFSGMIYRIICYIIFMVIGVMFILRYATKIKKDPSKSILYEFEGERDKDYFKIEEIKEFTTKQKFVLLIFVTNIIFLLYGVIQFSWYTTELTALFLGFGLLAGVVGGLSPNEIAKQFGRGVADVAFGALIVGFARAIVVVLEDAYILDTIIYGLSQPIMNVGNSLALVAMFIIQSLINFFIGSGSGQAAATMPIMIPLSDIVGITRQSTVLAFQFGDGITNMLWPGMIYYLSFADIPYDRWFKHILKLVLILSLAAAILVAISGVINYRPF